MKCCSLPVLLLTCNLGELRGVINPKTAFYPFSAMFPCVKNLQGALLDLLAECLASGKTFSATRNKRVGKEEHSCCFNIWLVWKWSDRAIISQVTDYAIARRIVDLHSRIEESVDRVYSLDDIRRYLLFARQFKPKVILLYCPSCSAWGGFFLANAKTLNIVLSQERSCKFNYYLEI